VVTSAIARIQRNPSVLKTSAPQQTTDRGVNDHEGVMGLANRLHSVIRQIRKRHDNRATLDVKDEYDVQDLFHALLAIYFHDIREEEWTPSYAGGASRMDFLLPEIKAVVEIKMMRPTLTTRQLGEQLIVDIAKYKTHPVCRTLLCVVYDPETRISNPRGLEDDLSKEHDGLATQVMIVPKV
jgi:REase_DpnII-MboI